MPGNPQVCVGHEESPGRVWAVISVDEPRIVPDNFGDTVPKVLTVGDGAKDLDVQGVG